MADPVLRLDNARVAVQPDGQAQVGLTLTSTSAIVEGFALSVLGPEASAWAEVVPPTVNVFPGEEATAVVVFSPPGGAAAASGTFPFGVLARSTESADVSAVAEGDVELGAVSGLQAKIIPVTSAGRWRGRHVLQLSNWGNSPAHLRLVASDPDAALGFYLRPDTVELPIGASTSVRLQVRTRKPFLRGTPTRLPFQVVGEPVGASPGPTSTTPYGDPSRPVVDAALNQKPILSRSVVTLTTLALVLAVAGGVYAFTRPDAAPTSLAGLGPPPKPEEFAVAGVDPGGIRLRWEPVDQIDGYELLHTDPRDEGTVLKVEKVDGSQNSTLVPGLAPDTQACFKLRALRDDLRGPLAGPVCQRTALAPASPSASPTGSGPPTTPPPSSPAASPSSTAGGDSSGNGGGPGPGPDPDGSPSSSAGGPLGGGKWVIVAEIVPQDGGLPGKVDSSVKALTDKGLTSAQVVDSKRYPKLGITPGVPLRNASWLAVVGPYDSPAAAQKDCATAKAVTRMCYVVQPEPT